MNIAEMELLMLHRLSYSGGVVLGGGGGSSNALSLCCSGKVSPEVVIELMRKCNPPVGWGKLCPQTVAYKVSKPKVLWYIHYIKLGRMIIIVLSNY